MLPEGVLCSFCLAIVETFAKANADVLPQIPWEEHNAPSSATGALLRKMLEASTRLPKGGHCIRIVPEHPFYETVDRLRDRYGRPRRLRSCSPNYRQGRHRSTSPTCSIPVAERSDGQRFSLLGLLACLAASRHAAAP